MNESIKIILSKNLLVTNEQKKKCKILKFTADWKPDEIISEISKFDAKVFKNLFIFEIKPVKQEDISNLLNVAKKFCEKRPLIIHLAQESDEKIFYTIENSNEWTKFPEKMEEKVEKIQDTSSFLHWFKTKEFVDEDALVTEACKVLSNPDQLTLRLLALELSLESQFHLVSHCAANYSKAQFFAALGMPFCSDERFLEKSQANFLINTFTDQERSILEAAIGNENEEVLQYLISYCSHLLRQLPWTHQQKIIAELIEANKFDIFCDLLEYCDFVFPSEFDPEIFSHERLKKVVEKRQKFHNAIENENYEEIYKFIGGSDLKLVNNIHNKTALCTALETKKYEMYYHLKSLGFKSNDCEELLEDHNGERLKEARNSTMKMNLKASMSGYAMAIYHLTARSKIFGKHSYKEYDKIRSWFEAIYRLKQGRSLLNAVSQCSRLLIIFDFESDDVERVNLDTLNAEGVIYPDKKLVIVGAKHSTEEQEQKVKGILAHELFHYAMRITFENREQPYLNKHDERYEFYKEIVDSLEDEFYGKEKDDGCDGIISTVFTLYEPKDFHAELIVRPIQILVRYDNDELKVKQLRNRYKPLFKYVDEKLIQPMNELDMRQREAVREFNDSAGLASNFFSKKLNFPVSQGLKNLIEEKLYIFKSNVPKLFLANIYHQLKIKDGNLVNSRNIFISSKEFKNSNNRLKRLLEEADDFKVFIEFSSGDNELFNDFSTLPFSNFFFITNSPSQSEKVQKQFRGKLLSVTIDYEWEKLPKNIQEKLLETKVNFQNNKNMTLGELLERPQDIIDTELLNMILEDSTISINSKDELDDHFCQLFRERNFIWKNQTISLKELLEKSKNEPFVLISDVAGTGKSWAMKNISKELVRLNPTNWMTFVDLKQLIPAFKEQEEQELNFLNFEDFIMKVILEGKSKYEIEIFKQKCTSGNLLIFFDGFDEIAPKSTIFLQELMRSFDSTPCSNPNSWSRCNQLWISTRDFFEMSLCEQLGAPLTCKLAEFTADDGINLISTIWGLHDLENQKRAKKSEIKNDEIEDLQKLAREICLKMPTIDLDSIGQPLTYKMLATVTKDKRRKLGEEKFTNYQLFEEFWKISEEDWSNKKGEYRKITYTENKKCDLNFLKVHQLKAMEKFMPEMSEYCDLDTDNEEWEDEDLLGCGLLTKTGEDYFFIHETFSEFFVAQFIVRILRKSKVNANVFVFINEIVSNPKHEVIRMLLNEGLMTEQKVQEKLDEKAQKVAKKVEEIKNLYEIFTKNLQNLDQLSNLWFLILKHWNYEKLVEILAENIESLIFEHETKITENSLKILLNFFTSSIEIQTIKEVMEKLARKLHPKIMQEVLDFKNSPGENIFFVLQKTKTINEKMFEKFMKILKEFLAEAQIAEKMMTYSTSGESILHSCVRHQNIQNLKIFWTEFEAILHVEYFKVLLMKRTKGMGETILHHAAVHSKSIDLHEALWSLLLKRFDNQKSEFKKLVLCQNVQNNNFINYMVQYNNSDVLNWTLNKLKSILNEDEVREILRMKDFENANLLQNALEFSKLQETHHVLWTFLLEMFSNETREFVIETDFHGQNLLSYIVRFSSADIFNFYIQELEKFISNEEMRKVLCCLNDGGQNLLQVASDNNSLKVHERLWEILRKYFDSSEILEFLSLHDNYGDNILRHSPLYRTKEVIQFSQTEIIKEIMENCPNEFESVVKLKFAIENKMLEKKWNQEEFQILSLSWVGQENISFSFSEDMEKVALNTDKTIHEEFWTFLLEKYRVREIKEIMLKKNIFGVNFFHQVLRNESLEVIQLTFNKIRDIANLNEIFKSTNLNGQNLLQYSACKAVNITVYEYLWELLKKCFNSDEIFNIFEHKDKFGNNMLQHVASFSTGNAVELTWKQIGEDLQINYQRLKNQIKERNFRGQNVLHVSCHDGNGQKLDIFWAGIKKVFCIKGEFKEFVQQRILKSQTTFLHQMACFCKDIECHKTLWKLLLKAFKDKNELKDFLLSQNCTCDNFLFDLIRFNTSSDVIKYTFKTCQKTFNHAQFNEILKSRGVNDTTLIHCALRYTKDIEIHKILWNNLSNCEKFADVLAFIDSDGWNILNHVAKYSSMDILDFMYEELKNLSDMKKVVKIIFGGRNFLHFAVEVNQNLEFLKSLWNWARTFLDTPGILSLIHFVNADGENLLQYAVKCSTKEVVDLTWTELKTFLNPTEQETYLKKRNGKELSLIGIATKHNQPAEVIDLIRNFIKTSQNEDKEPHETRDKSF